MINTFCEILIPKSLNEVLQLLANEKEPTKILAGGTDIITGVKQESKRFADAKILIDVNNVPEIKGIEIKDEKIIIGSAVTFSELCSSPIIQEHLPILKKAVSTIGSIQIRNRATIAGNFVNNAPCADSIPSLLVYDASLEIESLTSKKETTLQEFLLAPYKTQINQTEIVTKIIIPIPSKNYTGDFYKLGRRRSVAISRLTLAVLVRISDQIIKDIRIASGAITPIGTRIKKLEQFACNKKYDEDFCRALSQKMGEEILEVTGLRWSSAYKLPVVQQMFFQLLMNLERL